MSSKWLSVLLLLGILFTGGKSLAQAQAQVLPTSPVIEVDDNGLTITWTPPAYELNTLEIEGESYSQLQLPGFSSSGGPGQPELPFYSGLIGLPPTGKAKLQIVELQHETVALPHPPVPAAVPQPVHLAPTELDPASIPNGPSQRSPDPQIYSSGAFYPEAVAALDTPQQIRDRRVAALTLYPLRVNPVRGQLEVVRFVQLKITFTDPAPISLSAQQTSGDAFSQALGTDLLNPAASRQVAVSAEIDAAQADRVIAATANILKIRVDQAGLYALTYTHLQNAGLPVSSLDPRTLKLSHGYPRQEVALQVEGETDGVFNASDRLLFYAEPVPNRYVNYEVYFLSYGGANGLRMSSRAGSPGGLSGGSAWRTAVAEVNKFYDPLYPGRDGDYWYWAKLSQPSATSGSYALQVEKPLTTGPNATLTLWLQGYTDPSQNPDHKVRVAVNGTVVGEKIWNGATAVEAAFAVPSAILLNGSNQISLTLPGVGTTVEGMWLDALALKYPTGQAGSGQLSFQGEANQKSYTLTGWPTSSLSVYDITHADTPQQVTGYQFTAGTLVIGDAAPVPTTYLVVPTGSLKSPLSLQAAEVYTDPPGGADYIIITPAALSSAVAPLAAHRTARGLRVFTVNVEKIYDAFGPGRLDAVAIKNFLQYAYDNWSAPAPLYVLLVGDGTYDFKDYSGYHAPILMPPYMAPVDPWWGETASDNQFVTLTSSDNLPDMLIGRISVNTTAEAATVVNKIIAYETSPASGSWNAWQLLVADNPDSAGDFHLKAEAAYTEIKEPFRGNRFYYNPAPGNQPYIYTSANTLRASFLSFFNAGSSLTTFYGHSSWLQWAIEDLFDVNMLGQLNNQGRLPVVLEMTCFTGFFHHPAYPNTLDENLLRRSGGGAVAVWGSTGLGVATGHDALQEGFYQAITEQNTPTLGAAVLAGKMRLYASGIHLDLLDTYTLFGDPALALHLTVEPINYSNFVYLPLISR